MPIYEYACNSCGHVFDVLQKMDAPLLVDCPECHRPELKKLLSAPNFRLKGSGWYETDFKKDNRRNLADGAKGDKADGKADGKGDASKPADKATGAKTGAKPGATPAAESGGASGKTGASGAKSD